MFRANCVQKKSHQENSEYFLSKMYTYVLSIQLHFGFLITIRVSMGTVKDFMKKSHL